MMTEAGHLEAAIAVLEAQRASLGDAAADAAISSLRERISKLRADAAPVPAMQRRQVTVLFADIVDSTSMGEKLDAEDVVHVMSEGLARFAAAVRAHHGRVLRYTGDGLKAVFGADEALEDVPESAVRAGLAILEAARVYAIELHARTSIDNFRARVGLDTGLVAIGAGIEAENTAMGKTVNLAARMEQSAPPGCLRVTQATYRHVRGVFDVSEEQPMVVKGIAGPVRSYLVHRAKPRAFRVATRGIEGIETPMIGRDAELERLRADFDAVVSERRLHAITILGDAGLGKSRLVYELQEWLETHEQSVWLLLGRAHAHNRLQPYGLLRDVLAWRLRIDDSDSAELAQRKFVEGLREVLGPDAEPELLGQLIGLDFSTSPAVLALGADARRLRDRAFRVGIEWLRKLGASDGSPIVLLLDDLHWADDGSLEFVRRLLREARELPVLLVMVARPELLERDPQWFDAAGQAMHRAVRLQALDRSLSEALAGSLLQRLAAVPPTLSELIIAGAEGNPFYMEELVKMLIDDGVIVVDADAEDTTSSWHVQPERLRKTRVPGTLAGVLQARVDALGPAARSALQDAAVIGHVFWDRALAAIDPTAPASIDELLRKELTLWRPDSKLSGCREYAFVHHLLHQVTYDSVLKPRRRAAHARTAAWLAEQLHERAGEFVAVTAEHYARAGERAEAARYFEQAARNARERYANEEALEHLRRGLELVDADDTASRWRLLDLQHMLCDHLGRYDAMQATLDAMFAVAQQAGDSQRLGQIVLKRSLLADRRSEYDKARTLSLEAAALAEGVDDFESAALAHCECGYASTVLGDYATARASVEAALKHSQRCSSPLFEAKSLGVWSNLETAVGNNRTARDVLQRAVAIARRSGELRLGSVLLGNLADIQHRIGEFDAARANLQASLGIARRIELRSTEGRALLGLAQVGVALGDHEAAVSYARQAIEIAAAIGDRHARSLSLTALAQALAQSGSASAAAAAAREALEEEAACGTEAGESAQIALSVLASALLDLGDVDDATQHAERLLGLFAAQGDKILAHRPDIAFTCYRVLSATRDARAARMLAGAHAALLALAAGVDPAARERYLSGVPEHVRILTEWANNGAPNTEGPDAVRPTEIQ